MWARHVLLDESNVIVTFVCWARGAEHGLSSIALIPAFSLGDDVDGRFIETWNGPFASRVLSALPSCHELTLDSPPGCACPSRSTLHPRGGHRAASPRSVPAARVCYEAGASVACIVFCTTSTSTPSDSMTAGSKLSPMLRALP